MDWKSFAAACPEIAQPAEEAFRRDELVMLGTLRKDGWPRISPCELDFVDEHLMLGMMWRSPKALDLQRDPRIVVHSVTCDRRALVPDLKIYGSAVEHAEPDIRRAYRDAIKARIDWEPEEPSFHVFSLDIRSAGYLRFQDGKESVMKWNPSDGLRSWSKNG
jgi:hypothetical protein